LCDPTFSCFSRTPTCDRHRHRPMVSTADAYGIARLKGAVAAISRTLALLNSAGTNFINYHGLRGTASPVLTATGFVNGRGQFSTPTESTPLDRSPRNLLLVITSATLTAVPNLVQIRPRGLLGKWVKYNDFFKNLLIYLFIPFFMNRLDPSTDFHA